LKEKTTNCSELSTTGSTIARAFDYFPETLKKNLLELRRGRRPGNPQADSQHSSRNPPPATQKESRKFA